ncbi:DUF7528 family protein [Haladaptatus sp. ZSTT2]|uniref:DUF7528 family protein n=1 Tax=Haladaptatus sp. ZSTT2 TaxID=3120515 RepID=UPI00300ED448
MTSTPEGVVLRVNDETTVLSRAAATRLRDALRDALTETREYVYTSGTYREDGSYVVARRGATSVGHSKVFEDFRELQRLYDRLPEAFTADDLSRSGLTGGRRHMLLRHFVEHPAFDCRLEHRQPLTARKVG